MDIETRRNDRRLQQAAAAIKEGVKEGEGWSMETCLTVLASGKYTPRIGGEFLRVQIEGLWYAPTKEKVDELVVAARVLAESMTTEYLRETTVVQAGSTGGSGLATRFVGSTTLAVWLAASVTDAVVFAKFGNIGQGGGASGFLEKLLGVPATRLTPARAVATLQECRVGFVHAPTASPLFAGAALARREAALPTLFNAIAPLCNPIHGCPSVVVSGVCPRDMIWVESLLASKLGRAGVFITSLIDGGRMLDEASVWGLNTMVSVGPGRMPFKLDFATDQFLPKRFAYAQLGDSQLIARSIFERTIPPEPAASFLFLNAALLVHAQTSPIEVRQLHETMRQIRVAVKEGRPSMLLERFHRSIRENR